MNRAGFAVGSASNLRPPVEISPGGGIGGQSCSSSFGSRQDPIASVAWQNTVARHKVQAVAVNDNAEDDDLFDDGPNRRVYLARWPDGSATLLTARSLVEVADLLDGIGDPGGCEVAPYDGAVCVHLRPQPNPEAGYLALHEGSFEYEDARISLLRAAFPILAELVDRSDPEAEEPAEPSPAKWAAAAAREESRELHPSPAWQAALSAWWNQMTGSVDEEPGSEGPDR